MRVSCFVTVLCCAASGVFSLPPEVQVKHHAPKVIGATYPPSAQDYLSHFFTFGRTPCAPLGSNINELCTLQDILIDGGSNTTTISRRVVKQLDLPKFKAEGVQEVRDDGSTEAVPGASALWLYFGGWTAFVKAFVLEEEMDFTLSLGRDFLLAYQGSQEWSEPEKIFVRNWRNETAELPRQWRAVPGDCNGKRGLC